MDVSDVPADFDLPPSSWGTPSTEQLPDPTRPENTETAEPTKKPETSNVDSTGKTNSDNTGPSSQQGSEPNKQPTVNVPFDPDTPADEQIIKNTWKFRDNYKLKGPSDFSFTPWSYKIPADVQIQQNQYSDLSRSKGPTTVEWSDTIPLSDQQREIMRQAERKLLNEACKAAQALGKPIDVCIVRSVSLSLCPFFFCHSCDVLCSRLTGS